MDAACTQSVIAINSAVDTIYHGGMEPWFWKKQTCREWFARQDPEACAKMVQGIQDAMVTLRLDGRFNAAARMCEVLVHAVERGRQA